MDILPPLTELPATDIPINLESEVINDNQQQQIPFIEEKCPPCHVKDAVNRCVLEYSENCLEEGIVDLVVPTHPPTPVQRSSDCEPCAKQHCWIQDPNTCKCTFSIIACVKPI